MAHLAILAILMETKIKNFAQNKNINRMFNTCLVIDIYHLCSTFLKFLKIIK